MMKKLLFHNLIILIVLFSTTSWAQDLEKDILPWLEKYSKQELSNQLNTIKKKYPNSPVPLFLEAYLEENGERSIELYKQFIQQYPNSKFTDDALLKVAQYYYALGSYVSTRQYLDNLADQFPESPLLPEVEYLAARCLIATGYYNSAEEELKEIIKKYPQSPFKDHAKQELNSLEALTKQENSPPPFDSPNLDQYSESKGNEAKYTIQIGAFKDRENAIKQQELFSQKGYLVAIHTKDIDNNILYLVWVGEFETEEQAAKFGEVFSNLHSVSFHVVKK